MGLTEKLKRKIKESADLTGFEKLEALILLDEATQAKEIKGGKDMIFTLQNLYQSLESPIYKEAIRKVLREYESRVRVWKEDYEPVTLQKFLENLGISTKEVDTEILDLPLTVGIDDGMGYSPSGFSKVTEAYKDKEEIRLWV